MGSNKSFALLDGKPVFGHVLERLSALELPICIVTNTPNDYARYALPMFPDVLPDQGSLGGLYTAIQSSGTEHTLCVACDMPFLNVALLRYLISLRGTADIIVPRVRGYPETLHAVYRRTCAAPIRAQIERGNLRISAFYDQVTVQFVEEDQVRRLDPDLQSFVNLNTPDELAAANQRRTQPPP